MGRRRPRNHWLSHNSIVNLWVNQQTLAEQGITINSLEQDLRKDMPLPLPGLATMRSDMVCRGLPGAG